MTRTKNPNPTNWDEYQYGTSPHRGSMSSTGGRSVQFETPVVGSPSGSNANLDAGAETDNEDGGLRRRRSSMALRFNALAQVGGVNSIENFARSWTRAAAFPQVAPQRPSFIVQADEGTEDIEGEASEYGRRDVEYGQMPRMSLIRAHMEASGSPEDAIEDEPMDGPSEHPLLPKESIGKRLGSDLNSVQGSVRGRESIFAIAPHLSTPLAGSYGTSYGTLQSTLSERSMNRAGELWREQQAAISQGEREPLIVKEIEQDGQKVYVIAGQSTLPQTIFNSTNVLVGVGLLSLPMGMKYAGWICGMVFLFLSAIVTAYTAKILARCMDVDASLVTFADLAYISYGRKARIATSVLFTLELLAACVALTVLFADTLNLFFPGIGVNEWKVVCGLLLIPLNFAPLRLLSVTSVVGIFSTFSIVLIIFVDGFIKPHTPGSLREPAETYLFPSNWLTLPLSFGLLMSPWGGHGVFPNIYRDMRHPQKFGRAIKTTFGFTYTLDCLTAVAGYLMYGDGVLNELTGNILETRGYPRTLSILLSIFIAIIPLTKVPLNARPIVSTIDVILGLDAQSLSSTPALNGLSGMIRGLLKVLVRIVVVIIFVVIAIVFPAFDSIMAFMGSTLCFTICVILPLLFYLKIFGKEVPPRERWMCWGLIGVCSVLAAVGTVFAFLPKAMIGAE
ncbi:hypothetical protein HYFRA_00005600 [Hymenoscyphus fraxineus]|uniref:Amino acid transporter transmembrane domain-containing protein n=1 Tax=Hymenoscyphus fraxineus TaxID=746836 RepID=A0A9N9KRJ1_9HELO|nr:hypothetical protein HYFRA_00005600 [Hymenoscyphus fraxineus]